MPPSQPQNPFRKAERFKSKLRLGIAGPSGAGKTMSALKLAHGVVGPKGKIAMIDTERGSGDLYAHLFAYDILTLLPPYAPKNYVDAIKQAETAGYEVIIIDSLSHAWSDEGGLLDQADKLSSGGNRFTVWKDLTPQHRALVNAMLNSPCHIVATVRSKQEYVSEKDEKTGKTSIRKMGLAPVQRDGMEYEFTVFMDVDQNHYAKVSKDRTDLFRDEVFMIDESVGERINSWLNEGRERPDPAAVAAVQATLAAKKLVMDRLAALGVSLPKDKKTIGKAIETAVFDLTKLALTDENLVEINGRLGVLLSEKLDLGLKPKPDTHTATDGPRE